MNLCVYGECFHRLRVDGRPKRIKKFTFTIVCVYNRLRVDGALVSERSTKGLTLETSASLPLRGVNSTLIKLFDTEFSISD